MQLQNIIKQEEVKKKTKNNTLIWHYLMVFLLQLLGNSVLKENLTAKLICKIQLFLPQEAISQYLPKNKIPTDKTRTDWVVLLLNQ